MAPDKSELVITHTSSGLARGESRSRVRWIMERSPSRASTCLARARRLRGQKRVPLPPAKIMGRKSIAIDLLAKLQNTSGTSKGGSVCRRQNADDLRRAVCREGPTCCRCRNDGQLIRLQQKRLEAVP